MQPDLASKWHDKNYESFEQFKNYAFSHSQLLQVYYALIEAGRCQAALTAQFNASKNIEETGKESHGRALHAIRKLPNVYCNVNMKIYLISEDDNCRENS